ncbi:MAG TPA: polysaccharide biosynthesis/export family protein [Bacteroidia bacterium]|nr:polysaccharide biosynthesis/export family protein [Bacteroidia bacterium]HRD39878.1 polysaccharide biosynthesis/export family protein [Bacteroidia bacterium]
MRKLFLLLPLLLLGFSSCKVLRSNLMLQTKKDFNYDKLSDSLAMLDYKIAPNDMLQYRVFTNDGFKLLDLANQTNVVFRNDLDVLVESDGNVKMPMLGYTKLAGLTIREAEALLQDKYSDVYVKPFVTIRVTNKRVIVFPGNNGVAKVLPLANNNTTVMEAIALAGGITEDGKAYKVKLIRNYKNTKPQVFLMDLSKIEGLASANTIVLANDIIYVEPRYRLARTLVSELTPIVTLISTTVLLYSLFAR